MKRAIIIPLMVVNVTVLAYMAVLFVNYEQPTIDHPASDQTAIAIAVTEAIYYGYNKNN